MQITETKLFGVKTIETAVFKDQRGWFMESYTQNKFCEAGIDIQFVQDNHIYTAHKGTIRGIHFQEEPMAQTKLIRCIRGAVMDVAVDLRKDSPTYRQWVAVELSEQNKKQVLIPKGFGHGYVTLTDDVEVIYKVDEFYSPEHDRGIIYNDPELSIEWGIEAPILSEKDKNAPRLKELL